uniref:Uncharacterized protein n=1 Tax=Oryza glumipatula TaxID=40148 RepID=A0A0E0BRE3_9ORYZ
MTTVSKFVHSDFILPTWTAAAGASDSSPPPEPVLLPRVECRCIPAAGAAASSPPPEPPCPVPTSAPSAAAAAAEVRRRGRSGLSVATSADVVLYRGFSQYSTSTLPATTTTTLDALFIRRILQSHAAFLLMMMMCGITNLRRTPVTVEQEGTICAVDVGAEGITLLVKITLLLAINQSSMMINFIAKWEANM